MHALFAGAKDTAVADAQAKTYEPQAYPQQWQSMLHKFSAVTDAPLDAAAGSRQYSTSSSSMELTHYVTHCQMAGNFGRTKHPLMGHSLRSQSQAMFTFASGLSLC